MKSHIHVCRGDTEYKLEAKAGGWASEAGYLPNIFLSHTHTHTYTHLRRQMAFKPKTMPSIFPKS